MISGTSVPGEIAASQCDCLPLQRKRAAAAAVAAAAAAAAVMCLQELIRGLLGD